MAIEAIAGVSAGAGVGATAAAAAPAATRAEGSDFASMLSGQLGGVDEALKASDAQLRTLAAGKADAPHDVMIAMEEARMQLMLVVEVRNRVVEAYQELVRMQL